LFQRRRRCSNRSEPVAPGGSGVVIASCSRNGAVARSFASAPPQARNSSTHGFLTGTIRSPQDLSDDDRRKTNPPFSEGNFEQNLRIADEVQAVAAERDATPAQVALAWLLARGDDIAPIPGTKRVSRVEENTDADGIELSAEQIRRLAVSPRPPTRHDDVNMAAIDR
jgi:hypothetical protein